MAVALQVWHRQAAGLHDVAAHGRHVTPRSRNGVLVWPTRPSWPAACRKIARWLRGRRYSASSSGNS